MDDIFLGAHLELGAQRFPKYFLNVDFWVRSNNSSSVIFVLLEGKAIRNFQQGAVPLSFWNMKSLINSTNVKYLDTCTWNVITNRICIETNLKKNKVLKLIRMFFKVQNENLFI